MAEYRGELVLKEDLYNNPGALTSLKEFVRSSVDYSKLESEEEIDLLKLGLDIALGKLPSPRYPLRMVFDNFEFQYLMGYGSFGYVWKARFTPPGAQSKDVALKQREQAVSDSPNQWKERDILIVLKHPRICNLIGAFVKRDVFLVMELCFGPVSKLRYRMSPANAIRFSVQLLEALEWLESHNVVHANVKPDNCLINGSNNLVLADFCSAFLLNQDQSSIQAYTSHGSPGYLDLEANRDLIFTRSTDVFSAACVIFEMDKKSHLLFYPYQDQDRHLYIDALIDGRVQDLPKFTRPTAAMKNREKLSDRAMSSKFAHLLNKMLAPSSTRISAKDALLHDALRIILKESKHEIQLSQNDFVTREFPMDLSRPFQFRSKDDPTTPGLLTFYYDENKVSLIDDSTTAHAPSQAKRAKRLKQTNLRRKETSDKEDSNDGDGAASNAST